MKQGTGPVRWAGRFPDGGGAMGRGQHQRLFKAGGAAATLVALVMGVVAAQDPPAPAGQPPALPNGKGANAPAGTKGRAARKGGLRVPVAARAKAGRAANPLAAPGAGAAAAPAQAGATSRLKFKLSVGEGAPLAATFYPSTLASSAPVVLLIHERDRSSKDFEESIKELKGMSLAEELQKQNYAVLAVDLRGHGENPRQASGRIAWSSMVEDLNAVYACLVDRHNWGEINLAKLGVVGLGEGANLAAAWAASGGGVSSEGRTSDLAALVLVSPMIDAQSQGLPAGTAITQMAARVPMALLYGERDTASAGLVTSVANVVKRVRTNKVEVFPSALHGYKMLRLEPGLPASLIKFLDTTIKAKTDDWEGRYLLTPVSYTDVKQVANPNRAEAPARKAAAPGAAPAPGVAPPPAMPAAPGAAPAPAPAPGAAPAGGVLPPPPPPSARPATKPGSAP